MSAEFKYEVAFSFLQDDEQLALEIADRVRDRVSISVFVYSERQNELAGTDGVEKFSRIFGEESRIVVVLYREGWGETKWTRVEENAIRARGFNEGHEFVLLVRLDNTKPPIWLPPTRLYFGFERYGIDGVASAIESRVQSVGGSVRVESVLDRAASIARNLDRKSELSRWRNSSDAVKAAADEVQRLFDELKKHAVQVTEQLPQMTLRWKSTGRRSCDVSIQGTGFSVRWYSTYENTLDQSGLIFETWELGRFLDDQVVMCNSTGSYEYNFDLDLTTNMGWRKSGDKRLLSTSQLAEYWTKKLIDMTHKFAS